MDDVSQQGEHRFGRFRLLPAERELRVGSDVIPLGPRAFDVLVVLVSAAGQLVPKDEIFQRVWPGLVVEDNNLQVQISSLRKILGYDAIATMPGVGYRFVLPLEAPTAQPVSPERTAERPSVPRSYEGGLAEDGATSARPRAAHYGWRTWSTRRITVMVAGSLVMVVAAIAIGVSQRPSSMTPKREQ